MNLTIICVCVCVCTKQPINGKLTPKNCTQMCTHAVCNYVKCEIEKVGLKRKHYQEEDISHKTHFIL